MAMPHLYNKSRDGICLKGGSVVLLCFKIIMCASVNILKDLNMKLFSLIHSLCSFFKALAEFVYLNAFVYQLNVSPLVEYMLHEYNNIVLFSIISL